MQPHCEAVYAQLVQRPGLNMAELARCLGINRGTLWRWLLPMDYWGLLLAEDDQGRLYPFRRVE